MLSDWRQDQRQIFSPKQEETVWKHIENRKKPKTNWYTKPQDRSIVLFTCVFRIEDDQRPEAYNVGHHLEQSWHRQIFGYHGFSQGRKTVRDFIQNLFSAPFKRVTNEIASRNPLTDGDEFYLTV